MSKMQVLEQVYPDEIPLILERKKEEISSQLMGYINDYYCSILISESIMALSGKKRESAVKPYFNELVNNFRKIQNSKKKEEKPKEYTEDYIESQLNKLRGLQKQIKQKSPK